MASSRRSSRRQPNGNADHSETALDEHHAFDDPTQRRELRSKYIALMGRTQNEKLDLVKPESSQLSEILEKTENLFNKVRHTREASLDSKLVLQVSCLATQQAQKLQADFVTFEPTMFADKLAVYMSKERLGDSQPNEDDDEDNDEEKDLDWEKLDSFACKFFKTVPTMTFMLGPLVIEAAVKKQRAAVVRTKKPDESQKVIPAQLDRVEEQEEATTREVARLMSLLKRLTDNGTKSISFFEFVLDPDSFGRTVENIFHISFPVKDGKVEISIEDGIPMIISRSQYVESEHEEVVYRKQMVMTLCMEEWKQLIDTFKITRPMIPPRRSGLPN